MQLCYLIVILCWCLCSCTALDFPAIQWCCVRHSAKSREMLPLGAFGRLLQWDGKASLQMGTYSSFRGKCCYQMMGKCFEPVLEGRILRSLLWISVHYFQCWLCCIGTKQLDWKSCVIHNSEACEWLCFISKALSLPYNIWQKKGLLLHYLVFTSVVVNLLWAER